MSAAGSRPLTTAGDELILDPRNFSSQDEADTPLFFVGKVGAAADSLWRYDATANSHPTVIATGVGPDFATDGKSVFFVGSNRNLWEYQINPVVLRERVKVMDAREVTRVGSLIFFTAGGTLYGWDPLLNDTATPLNPIAATFTNPRELLSAGAQGLYLVAGAAGQARVWWTDGTPAKEVLETGPTYRNAGQLRFVDGGAQEHVLFLASTGMLSHLWIVRPQSNTDRRAEQVTPASVNPSHPTVLGKRLYFIADGDGGGRTIWVWHKHDRPANEILTGETDDIQTLTATADRLYAQAHHSGGKWELLVLTGRGLTLLGEFAMQLESFVGIGDRLFFIDKSMSCSDLWTTTGTAKSTRPVMLSGDSSPSGYVVLGNVLIFAATGANSGKPIGREPWRSDGTKAGTFSLADLAVGVPEPGGPPVVSSDPDQFVATSDRVYFVARQANLPAIDHGRELFCTDGSAAGTKIVKEIGPGPKSAEVQHLTALGDKVYFSAKDAAGRHLWWASATSADKLRYKGEPLENPAELTSIGSHLFFTAGPTGRQIAYVTNGNVTVRLGTSCTIQGPARFKQVGTWVVFNANRGGVSGVEPFKVKISDLP